MKHTLTSLSIASACYIVLAGLAAPSQLFSPCPLTLKVLQLSGLPCISFLNNPAILAKYSLSPPPTPSLSCPSLLVLALPSQPSTALRSCLVTTSSLCPDASGCTLPHVWNENLLLSLTLEQSWPHFIQLRSKLLRQKTGWALNTAANSVPG